jgi:arginyl-tRNA synthetase
MLSFDGNTVAYLLYVIARIKLIIRKCNIDTTDISSDCLETKEEKDLAGKLTYFPMTLLQATRELRPITFAHTYLN